MSLLVSACVSSQPATMGLNASDISDQAGTASLSTNALTTFVDGDSGSLGTDDNGNAMMVAVPARANRVSSTSSTTEITNPNSELAASQDTGTAQLATNAPQQASTEVSSTIAYTTDTDSGEAAPTEPQTDQLATVSADPDTVTGATTEPAISSQPVTTESPKKPNFFQRMFATNRTSGNSRQMTNANAFSSTAERQNNRLNTTSGFQTASLYQPKQPASAPSQPTTQPQKRQSSASSSALPGVKSNSKLFDLGENEMEEAVDQTEVASLGGFGRISPNGLRIQHEKVQVACLKPEVLRILQLVERRYGKKPIITSGYRSPKRNRRAGGARNSQHIYCKAADIQVEGISKWDLAKFLRTIPGRGGVGTYCRTKSVHFDVGSKRDWHHPCRRSSARKRKKA